MEIQKHIKNINFRTTLDKVEYHFKYNRLGLIASTFALLLTLGVVLHYVAYAYASKSIPDQLPPAPQVQVEVITAKKEIIWQEFSGKLHAVNKVEIRPLVSGIITEVLFKEGTIVNKGSPLFTIDPRPYEAEVANAEASLESAKAQAALAFQEISRAKALVARKFISQSKYDTAVSNHRTAQAAINSAKARLQQANLNLGYANIKAPISGRISRAEATLGNIVEAGSNAPLMATIISDGNIYADFDVDEQTYLRAYRNSNIKSNPVELVLSGDNSVYRGAIKAFDNQLDSSSGTIRARAIFENPNNVLVPGMFVKVRLGSNSDKPVLMVSELAVGTDQNKKFVYVISPENKVTYREVILGETVKGRRNIISGLKTGEKVMVNGLMGVMPEMSVVPVLASDENAKPPVVQK